LKKKIWIEPEVTAKIAQGRFRVCEIPISYRGRTYDEGKKISWKDGFQALWCIAKIQSLEKEQKTRTREKGQSLGEKLKERRIGMTKMAFPTLLTRHQTFYFDVV